MMGPLASLHFLQKKGWLGVLKGEEWGTGDKNFFSTLFTNADEETQNDFLAQALEPLFFNTLNSDAMKEAISETKRRRAIQEAYNKEHGITPTTIQKAVEDILEHKTQEAKDEAEMQLDVLKKSANLFVPKERRRLIEALKKQMNEYAENLEYEQAAVVRDQIAEIEERYGK